MGDHVRLSFVLQAEGDTGAGPCIVFVSRGNGSVSVHKLQAAICLTSSVPLETKRPFLVLLHMSGVSRQQLCPAVVRRPLTQDPIIARCGATLQEEEAGGQRPDLHKAPLGRHPCLGHRTTTNVTEATPELKDTRKSPRTDPGEHRGQANIDLRGAFGMAKEREILAGRNMNKGLGMGMNWERGQMGYPGQEEAGRQGEMGYKDGSAGWRWVLGGMESQARARHPHLDVPQVQSSLPPKSALAPNLVATGWWHSRPVRCSH